MLHPITITPFLDDRLSSISEAQRWIMTWEREDHHVFQICHGNLDLLSEALRDLTERSGTAILLDAADLRIHARDFPDLVESLTTEIHKAIEEAGGSDDPEENAEAFESHPWAPLREALWAAEPKIRGEDCLRLEALSGDGIGSIDAVTAWRVRGGGEPARFEDEEELAQEVARRMETSNLSIRLVCLEHVLESEDIDHLCMALTEVIVDDIPSIEEEDARVDDFDNHPLAPIRDALVDVSPNFGGAAPDF